MLEGVYVANVTPFGPRPDHAVDVDSYLAHVRWLARMGVDGIVPFGTNGEGPSVTTAEKQAVLAEVLSAGLPLSVLPTVAEGTLPGTVDMLEYLNGVDVPAVLVLPPYFFTPVETGGLRLFYERVLEVSRHPVVVYHIPKYAVPVPADLVTTLGVWGVKDSGGEAAYADTVHGSGRGVLLGTEDDYPGRLPVATGVISALANVVPEQVRELYASVRAGEQAHASELSAHLQRLRAMTKEHASPGVLKALAEARHGALMGTVRPPLVPLPAKYDLGRALDVMGVTGLG